jgi:multidrug efflux pump subunit AcrA (membrane-fusion protein)
MFCRARVPVGRPFEALLIPPAAVVSDQGQRAVYVVGGDNRVESRLVDLGPLHRGLQVVGEGVTKDPNGRARGLARTARVVIRGMRRVEAGMEVEPQDGTISYPPPPPPAPGTAGPAEADTPAATSPTGGGPVRGAKGGTK